MLTRLGCALAAAVLLSGCMYLGGESDEDPAAPTPVSTKKSPDKGCAFSITDVREALGDAWKTTPTDCTFANGSLSVSALASPVSTDDVALRKSLEDAATANCLGQPKTKLKLFTQGYSCSPSAGVQHQLAIVDAKLVQVWGQDPQDATGKKARQALDSLMTP